jgi:Uma2 family endonuclease
MTMSTAERLTSQEEIEYPESDGEPMAENTVQYDWITTIKGGLDIVFQHDPDVFITGDLFWYPVQGRHANQAIEARRRADEQQERADEQRRRAERLSAQQTKALGIEPEV